MAIKRSTLVQKLARATSKKLVYKISDYFIGRKMIKSWDSVNSRRIKNFKQEIPVLNDLQNKVLADLRNNGFAAIDVRELISDTSLLDLLEKDTMSWINSPKIKESIANYYDPAIKTTETGNKKPYELKRYSEIGSSISIGNPLIQFGISKEILNIVNSYFGLNAYLYHVDQWHTLANRGKSNRAASQKWHRDPEDTKLVKVFLYMKDIPLNAGPFEYVLKSNNGNKYDKITPQKPPYGSLVDDADIQKNIPGQEVIAASFPKYTILFVDTTGIHRGGYAVDEDRLLCHWIFTSSVCPYYRYIDMGKKATNGMIQSEADALFE
jgi:hypothetical protein